MGMNKNGEIYYFAVTLDTCVFGHDTIITSGINSMVIVKYDKSGTLLGINHVNKEADYIGSNSMGIFVLPEGSYYIADGLTGSGYFGNNFITSNTPLDLLIAHYSNAGECLGVDHVGGGLGTSIAVNENAVYISGILSPFPSNTGSMSIANHTFQTYGYEDIVFIKHELITGKRPGIDKVVVYPNPNNGSFSVIVPIELLNEANLVLSLFDNLGKLLLKRSIAFNEWNPRVEIYGQPTGLYFITVSNGRKSYCGKMIVE
jgi:hypothetical protein